MSEEKPDELPRCDDHVDPPPSPVDVEYERKYVAPRTEETVAEASKGQTGPLVATTLGDSVSISRRRTRYGAPILALTADVHTAIVGSVRRGNFLETACKAAGVMPQTVRQWLVRGATGEEPYASFLHDYNVADGRCEDEDQSDIREAGKGDWKAKAWRLERKHPDRWGLRMKLEVQHQLERFLDRCKDSFDQATYEKLLGIAAEISGSGDLPSGGEGGEGSPA